jgi:hypothetical protein
MDRREAIGAGLTFGAGILGGGLTSGLLVHLDAEERLGEKDEELHKQLSFVKTVKQVDREVDMDPQQYLPIELTGSHPITGEPRRFEYRVEADALIDVFVMAVDEFLAYRDDNKFRIIDKNSSLNTDMATGSGLIESTFWVLVIDNTTDGKAVPIPAPNNVSIQVKTEE